MAGRERRCNIFVVFVCTVNNAVVVDAADTFGGVDVAKSKSTPAMEPLDDGLPVQNLSGLGCGDVR